METASWCSGLTCRPVTAKIVGSNPIEVASFAQVAQSVEQGTENPRVGGSIPSLSTITISHAVVAEWQTRYFEGVVNVSSYGFKSHQPHHSSKLSYDCMVVFFTDIGVRKIPT